MYTHLAINYLGLTWRTHYYWIQITEIFFPPLFFC